MLQDIARNFVKAGMIARKLGAQAVCIGGTGKPRKSADVAKLSVRFDETVKL